MDTNLVAKSDALPPEGFTELETTTTPPPPPEGFTVLETPESVETAAPPPPPGFNELEVNPPPQGFDEVEEIANPYDTNWNFVGRSINRAKRDYYLGGAATGLVDPTEAALGAAEAEIEAQRYKYSPDVETAFRNYPVGKSASEALSWFWNNPKAAAVMLGDNSANLAISTGTAFAGAGLGATVAGPSGAVVGTVLGAGLGSGLTDAASQITEAMAEEGIDLTSQEQIESALTNPEFMSRAQRRALLHGVSVGAIDAVTSLIGAKGVGGKIVDGIWKTGRHTAEGQMVDRTVGQIAAEAGTNTLIESTGAATGEALGQWASLGKVDWSQVVPEAILELPGSVAEGSLSTAVAAFNRQTPASEADILAAAGGPDVGFEMPTAEEAAAKGRTLFGFDEGNGKPVELTEDYAEAERRMGMGPARRGRLIAVSPDETVEAEDAVYVAKSPEFYPTGVAEVYSTKPNRAGSNELPVKIVARNPFETRIDATQFSNEQIEQLKSQGHDSIVNRKTGQMRVFDEKQVHSLVRQQLWSPKTWNGNSATREVRPNLQNPLGMGHTNVILNGNLGAIVGTHSAADGIDLDGTKLFAALKGKAYYSVRDIRKAVEAWGLEAIRPQVKINDAALDTKVFNTVDDVNFDEWKAAVADGRVEFNPDSRLAEGRQIGVQNTTKEELKAAVDAAKITLPKGITRMSTLSKTQGQSMGWPSSHTEQIAKEQDWFAALSDDEVHAYDPYEENNIVGRETQYKDREVWNLGLEMMRKWKKELGIKGKLIVMPRRPNSYTPLGLPWGVQKLISTKNALGNFWSISPDLAYISIQPGLDSAEIYRVMAHEFGHYISAHRLSKASTAVRGKIWAAYRRWIAQMPGKGQRPQAHIAWRRDALSMHNDAGDFAYNPDYLLSFEEWFAEQIARWGTTDAKVQGEVTQFLKRLADEISRILNAWRVAATKIIALRETGAEDFRAEPEIEDWINGLRSGQEDAIYSSTLRQQFDAQTTKANEPYLKADSVPRQVETEPSAAVQRGHIQSLNPSQVASTNAHQDRFNWFYKWGLSLRQIALRNPHIASLQKYLEWIDLAKLESNTIMSKADVILRAWRNAPGRQADAITDLLFDLTNMVYLSPQEVKNNVRRWPTAKEMTALVQKHRVSKEGLAIYSQIRDEIQFASVDRIYQLMLLDARKIVDPRMQQKALTDANDTMRALLQAPYFPFKRFGKWAVTVRDAKGNVEEFSLFDTKKQMQQAGDEAKTRFPSNYTVLYEAVPQEVQQFLGMPTWLIDKLMAMPGLSPDQMKWMQGLRYELAPSRSFAKHLMKRRGTAGYSLDGRRVFASYMFSHARHYARVKYGELAEAEIGLTQQAELSNDPKKTRIADAMREHWKEFVNPAKDWALFRSATALWHLGFVPAAAAINLSQTVLMTTPFLADKFGDGKAIESMMKAAGDLSTYYKRATLANMQGHHFRAIEEAQRQGIIDESQAWELASMSGGARSRAGQFGREVWLKVASTGMFMFQMAEKWNRRVTFRAAYQLAYDNPNAKWLQQLRTAHSIQYDDLVMGKGWTDREAMAFIAGKETTRQTQFGYDKLERPRFMRGRKASLFAFYMFTQNSLFTLWNNPGASARYLLIMAALAGPMGLLPDDIEDILEFIGKKLFGKAFSVERSARQLIVDMMGKPKEGEEEPLPPDLILHGIGRYGFGIPWMMDQIGVNWMPNLDRSAAVSINRVLPLGGMTGLLNPGADVNATIAKATQDVAGAAFGPAYAIYRALQGSDLSLTDIKRWEAAFPRALRRSIEATRLLVEGGERDKKGNITQFYDVNDPQQVAEAIAIAMGYTPTRKSQFYDRRTALYEVESYWKITRQMKLNDAFNAKFGSDDPEDYAYAMRSIREFNAQAKQIDPKLIIGPDTIKRSFQAKLKIRRQVEEEGLPQGIHRGVASEVDELYPETVIQTKKVR